RVGEKATEKSVDDKALEKRVTQLVKNGDTRKALQQFTAAPFAPKTEATFEALKALHPDALRPVPPATSAPSSAPMFSDKLVREALSTFSPSSAAGLFGYRPWILQQCARAESFHFVATLARAVNMFARDKLLNSCSRAVRPSLSRNRTKAYGPCARVTHCA